MDRTEVLRRLPVFKGLSEESLETLAAGAEDEVLEAGRTILSFGDVGRFFGVVLSGAVEVSRERGDGEREVFARLEAPEYFGEMSLMTGEPVIADVVAAETSEVLRIPHGTLSAVIAREPKLAATLAVGISRRLVDRERNLHEQERLREAHKAQADPYGLERFPLADGGRILTVNCGSSSLKYRLFDSDAPGGGVTGLVERIGLPETRHRITENGSAREEFLEGRDHGAAFEAMVRALGGDEGLQGVKVVGHRVVHGGEKYGAAVVIDDDVLADVREFAKLAPLHVPANLAGIDQAMRRMPGVPQVAVFDTGFHRTLPRHAFLYGLPYEHYEKDRVRRYGFHGMSHKFVAYRAAAFLKRPLNELKIISCHLGNGASITAVDHGRSVDTSMGMTPLEGLIMGTRSGDVDPGALLHLQEARAWSAEQLGSVLNRESGLKGLSGVSSDMREVLKAAREGNDRAVLAVQAFCYRVKKYIGSYWAVLGGVDAVIFTGGIGEGSAEVRARVCQGMAGMGLILDEERNRDPKPGQRGASDVATEESPVRILVVPTDEERMIAREAARALTRDHMTQILRRSERPIPVGVSAHHVHLSKDDVEALFGPGRTLTFKTPLSQPGQFACQEQVTLKGPKGTVERVRVLGPERKESQVEISRTEEFKLGVDAPVRLSGDLGGTPGLVLEGPEGRVALDRGVICALRHIHMNPEEALTFGVKDKDVVMVALEGERSLIFGDVVVRVNPQFKLDFHLDTDEANAAEVSSGMHARLHSIQSRRA